MTDTGAIPKSAPRSRRADDRWMRSILRGQKFEGRGFSRCTVDALLAHGISAARTAVVHDRDRASEHSRHWCDFTRGDFALSQATLLGSVTNPRAPPPRIEKGPTVRAGHAATRPRQKKGRLFHTRRRQ